MKDFKVLTNLAAAVLIREFLALLNLFELRPLKGSDALLLEKNFEDSVDFLRLDLFFLNIFFFPGNI